MTKADIQKALDEFVTLGNKLDAEAKRLYGKSGFLFHEADGGVHIMDGDADRSIDARQKHVKHTTTLNARWGAGAW